MDWTIEIVSKFALSGSLVLLAWGAALCLEEALARDDSPAGCAGSAAAGLAPAHAGEG
jgi:hypothetical protein